MKEQIDQNNQDVKKGLSWESEPPQKIKSELENLWSNFKAYFWTIFIIKIIISYGVVKSEAWVNFLYRLNLEGEFLFFINLLIQFLPAILMVYVMGYYAYKISGNKLIALKGLWGFLWFGIIFIFIGYYSVKREYDAKLKKNHEEV